MIFAGVAELVKCAVLKTRSLSVFARSNRATRIRVHSLNGSSGRGVESGFGMCSPSCSPCPFLLTGFPLGRGLVRGFVTYACFSPRPYFNAGVWL